MNPESSSERAVDAKPNQTAESWLKLQNKLKEITGGLSESRENTLDSSDLPVCH